MIAATRTARFRALRQATVAWRDGHPHEGMEILAYAGFTRDEIDHWVRVCQRHARQRYQRIMERTA
jgi:hypothetical protein